jgi:hypothetical protein
MVLGNARCLAIVVMGETQKVRHKECLGREESLERRVDELRWPNFSALSLSICPMSSRLPSLSAFHPQLSGPFTLTVGRRILHALLYLATLGERDAEAALPLLLKPAG